MGKRIGLFDSGVGGLTVLAKIMQKYPTMDIIYVGDNGHCPYGDKTKQQLLTYSSGIVEYFLAQGINDIVLACNTTTSTVLNDLIEKYPEVNFVGVIDSTVNALLTTSCKKVLVIATNATISSNVYQDLILSKDNTIDVAQLATPSLVPLIESGEYLNNLETHLNELLSDYLGKIDGIILGCTHYPIISTQIAKVLGNEVEIISSSEAIVNEIPDFEGTGRIEIFTTGAIDTFILSSKGFFEYEDIEVKRLYIK